jgi:hypothetical protein
MKQEYKDISIKEAIERNLTFKDMGIEFPNLDGLKNVFEQFNQLTKNISNSFKLISEQLEKRNPIFIEEDWYLSDYYWRKFKLFEMYTITPRELETTLFKLFEKDKSTIKSRLTNKHKERSQILNELFLSYKMKNYHSVVLISYSLTDGISKEKFGLNFWGYDNKRNLTQSSKISELVESDSVLNIVQKRLNVRGELSLKSEDIPKQNRISSYNRHCVIHGESYLFGNKINAVKSIFLLDFISSLN